MPNRVIKESINESSGLSTCSLFAQDLYKRLITYADDYGRFNADTMIMLARLYPREIYSISEQDILDGLIELAGVGKIGFYRPNVFNQYGKSGIYGAFPKWGEHQRLRDSRQKCPDPEDTSVNDWYLRRFIPMDLKRAVLERDKMKCSICGKYVTSCQDVTRFLKLGAGLYHIDHIVPVLQGGRATLENLRLTCPDCNLKRKKKFTFSEILEETINGCQSDVCGESPQVAESCGDPPPESESESNPNPNQNPSIISALSDQQAGRRNPEFSLPLNTGEEYPIFGEQIENWQSLYPAVNVMQELRGMRGWLEANPAKRKTKSGINRFINGWLAREQNRGPGTDWKPARRENSNPFLEMLREEQG